MSSISEFEIKNVRTVEGFEGTGLIGNLYYKGKKLGGFADYGDGAITMSFDFDSKKYNEMLKEAYGYNRLELRPFPLDCEIAFREPDNCYFAGKPNDTNIPVTLEDIIFELNKLNSVEKVFKKTIKNGLSVLAVVDSIEGTMGMQYSHNLSDKEIFEDFAKRKNLSSFPRGQIFIARDMKDFKRGVPLAEKHKESITKEID